MVYNFEPGDVIYARRWKWGVVTYRHFGVYIGGGKVVNYQGEPGDENNTEKATIVISTLAEFANGDKVKADKIRKDPFPPEDTVRRALSFVGKGKGEYSLIFNNCEHFANYCKYGRKFSSQVRKDAWFLGAALAGLGILLGVRGGRGGRS